MQRTAALPEIRVLTIDTTTRVAESLRRAGRSNSNTFAERQTSLSLANSTYERLARKETDATAKVSLHTALKATNYALASLFLEMARKAKADNSGLRRFIYTNYYARKADSYRRKAHKFSRLMRA